MGYLQLLFITIMTIFLSFNGFYATNSKLLVVVAIFFLYRIIQTYGKTVGIIIVISIFSFTSYLGHYQNNIESHSNQQLHQSVGTIDEIKIKQQSTELTIRFRQRLFTYFLKIVLTEDEDTQHVLGEQVSITCRVSPITPSKNFKGFNFQAYAFSRRLYGQCFNPKVSHVSSSISFRYRIKKAIHDHIETYPKTLQPLLKRSILREKENDSSLEQLLKELSLTHLFMLSSYMLKRVERGLRFLLSYTRLPLEFLQILTKLLLCMFAVSIGVSQSYGLAYFFTDQLLQLGFIFFRKKFSYQQQHKIGKISLIHLLLLIIHPYNIHNLGFYYLLIIQLFYLFHRKQKQAILSYFYPIFLLFPLQIYLAPSIKISVLLATLTHDLFSTILLPCIGLSFLIPQVAPMIGPIIKLHQEVLNIFLQISGEINMTFYFSWQLILAILVSTFLIECLKKQRKRCVSFLIFICVFVNIYHFNHFLTSVHFIQLPEGEAILIKEPFATYMIDVGGGINEQSNAYMVEQIFIPLFQQLNIKKLDAIIITHEDKDHIGNLNALLTRFPVECVFIGESVEIGKHVQFNASTSNNVRIEHILKQQTIGPFMVFPELFSKEQSDPNNRSLIIVGSIGNRVWLFMGDLEKEGEHELLRCLQLNIPIDYLKVGHHGSKTSSTSEFIQKIQPKYAIIVVQTKNRFNHPHDDVINRLEQFKIKYVDTNKDGGKSYFFLEGLLIGKY